MNNERLLFIQCTIMIICCCHMLVASKHTCYVCGDQSEMPFSNANNSLQVPKSCNDMQKFSGAAENPYIFDCPDGYNGCITKKTTDSTIIRSCIEVSIDDCRSANDELICICKAPLCNNGDDQRASDEGLIDIDASNDTNDDDDDDDTEESGGDDEYITLIKTTTQSTIKFSSNWLNSSTERSNDSLNSSVIHNLSKTLVVIILLKFMHNFAYFLIIKKRII